MDRFYRFLAIAFFAIAPFWYGGVVIYDLFHPHVWTDPLHDPRIYGPLFGVVAVLAIALGIHIVITERRDRAKRDK